MKSLVLPLLLAVAPITASACGPAVWPPPSEAAAPVVADDAVAIAVPEAAPADTTAALAPLAADEPVPPDETVAISAADAEAGAERRCVRETGTHVTHGFLHHLIEDETLLRLQAGCTH